MTSQSPVNNQTSDRHSMPKEINSKANLTNPKSNTNLPSARYTQGNSNNNNQRNNNNTITSQQ